MATVGNLKVDLGLNSAAFDAGLNRAKGSMNSFAASASKAFGAMAAAAAAAFSIGAIGHFADEWSDLNSRLTNATGSAEAGASAMNRLQEVARRSYSSISQTTEAFLSQSTTLNALGVSTQKQLDLTETLNNALVISATRGDKARSVMDAWSKAMALGELRGDNLNSVIANSDRLAQALADSMGVSVNELRKIGAEGKITRQVMLGVTDQLETLREEAENMPATISDGFGILRDSVFQFVGRMDQATGASGNFAAMLIAVGDAITSATGPLVRIASIVSDALGPAFDALGPIIGIATSALAGFFAPVVIAGLGTVSVAIGTTMVGAVRALTAAMLANPLGLLIAGISAAISAAFLFRDEIKQAIGIDFVGIAKSAVNTVIGAFVGAFNGIRDAWGQLPAALGDLVYQAAQSAVNGVIYLVREAQVTIRGFLGWVDTQLRKLGGGLDLSGFRLMEYVDLDNPYAGAAEEVGKIFGDAFKDADQDYIGQLGKLWETTTGASDASRELGAVLGDEVSEGAGKAGRATKDAGDKIKTMGDIGQQVTSKLADSFTDMFIAVLEGGKNLGDMIGSLLKDLGRMFIHQGFQALLGMGGGGGGLFGGLFSGIGKIFGFARGGTIMPGGAGGIDSQLVMFRKSPNERVDITKPGQTLSSGDSGPSELNFNITVSGARGNAEIRQMVEQGMDSALQTVRQHLPDWVANPRVKFV